MVNLELPPGERNRNLQELAREDFATRTPTRVTSVEKGRLYLVEIKEAEHRMRLGLAIALDAAAVGKDSDGYDIFKVGWFVMGRLVQGRLVQSKNGWKVKNPSFVQYKQRGQLVTDDIGLRSFRLLVEDCDLTSKGLADKETAPRFRQDFAMRVQCFAREEKLSSAGTEDELSTDCSDCEEGAEAEGEEDGNEWGDDVDEQDEEEDGEDEQDEEDEEDEHEGDDQRCGDVDEEDEEMQEEEGAEEDAEVAPPRGEEERKREPRGAGGSSTESGETAKGAGAARADGGGRKRGSRAAKVASPRGAAGRKRVLRSVSQMGQGR